MPSTARELKLTLPLPSSLCGGNARGHWAPIHRARAAARLGAYWTAQQELLFERYPRSQPWARRATITIDWYGRTKRLPDRDNIISRCKPLIDGIVEAGVLDDDSPDYLMGVSARRVEKDRDNPRVELIVREVLT